MKITIRINYVHWFKYCFFVLIGLIICISCNPINDGEELIEEDENNQLWEKREYGVGIVKYDAMQTYSASDIIYSGSNVTSDTIAVLDHDSLYLSLTDTTIRVFERMIEYDYEISGFAIISFSNDTNWAEITLNPWNIKETLRGWVNLNNDGTDYFLWKDFLKSQSPYFSLIEDSIRFYIGPDLLEEVSVNIQTFSNSDRLDYDLWPIEFDGNWVKVKIESPGTYCRWPLPNVVPDTLWMEYISIHQRPLVYFYTRGC